jgi:hypothetical protein
MKSTLHRLRLSFLLILAVSMPFAAAGAVAAVVTDTGAFTGVPSPSAAGVDVFFGIRYAAAPEGALRWTPPQPPAVPAGSVVAATPGPACPQPASTAPLPQSEDCLFLNVYVPANEGTHAKRPVLCGFMAVRWSPAQVRFTTLPRWWRRTTLSW